LREGNIGVINGEIKVINGEIKVINGGIGGTIGLIAGIIGAITIITIIMDGNIGKISHVFVHSKINSIVKII
jgi:hypothetical protein